ncbi:GTPase Era [Marinibaculum pumilum]
MNGDGTDLDGTGGGGEGGDRDHAAAGAPRCGLVALLGAPNAGKSTLMNRIVGSKVSIVSPKVQTTRTRMIGIAVAGPAQIVFVDTPGIFRPRRRLDQAMVRAAWGGARDADLALLLVDAAGGVTEEVRHIARRLKERGARVVAVLNKVDKVRREGLLALSAAVNDLLPCERTFMISALDGSGVADLTAWLSQAVPEGPWLYPGDQVSDVTERVLAAEITREKLFLRLHEELPYASTVETEAWTEQPDGSLRIEQVVFVARESHRPIVLGKGGRTIRAIGSAARQELEELFGTKVHLFLFVKVRGNWEDDPERYNAMGLEFPKTRGARPGRGKGS